MFETEIAARRYIKKMCLLTLMLISVAFQQVSFLGQYQMTRKTHISLSVPILSLNSMKSNNCEDYSNNVISRTFVNNQVTCYGNGNFLNVMFRALILAHLLLGMMLKATEGLFRNLLFQQRKVILYNVRSYKWIVGSIIR